MSRLKVPRAVVAWVGVLMALVSAAACGQAADYQSQAPTTAVTTTVAATAVDATDPATTTPTTVTPTSVTATTAATNPPLPSGQTYEAVLLGPGEQPVDEADVAPVLFRDEPSFRRALETEFPAAIAESKGPFVYKGVHLIVVFDVAAAAETDAGVDVYGEMWMQWFALAGWQAVQDTGGSFPARARLKREGSDFRLEAVDIPKDGAGYMTSLKEMMPDWIIDRVDHQQNHQAMAQALITAAAVWAEPNVPTDLFVEQAPVTAADAHDHQPPVARFKMLAPRYVDCRLAQLPTPPAGDYQPEFAYASDDGRFRLFFMSTGGVAVEDTQTEKWWSIVTPGWPMMSGGGFDPQWSGHTVFIDVSLAMIDPLHPTMTHYEIDFDGMTVVRAVPMGPLSFNEPAD